MFLTLPAQPVHQPKSVKQVQSFCNVMLQNANVAFHGGKPPWNAQMCPGRTTSILIQHAADIAHSQWAAMADDAQCGHIPVGCLPHTSAEVESPQLTCVFYWQASSTQYPHKVAFPTHQQKVTCVFYMQASPTQCPHIPLSKLASLFPCEHAWRKARVPGSQSAGAPCPGQKAKTPSN